MQMQSRPVTFKGPGAKRIFSAKPSTVVSRSSFVVRAFKVTLKTPEGEQEIECGGAGPTQRTMPVQLLSSSHIGCALVMCWHTLLMRF